MIRDDAHPPLAAVRQAVQAALAEDLLPLGDITSSLLGATARARAGLVAREAGIVAGTSCVAEVCRQVDSELAISFEVTEGGPVQPGSLVATIEGPARSLLTAERTALNFLCHLSGVATAARRYVDAAGVANAGARIWDTRKTTPGLRALEKAAVRAGGAANHRGSLSEAILLKDNHLGMMSIADAVRMARQRWPGRMIEVECDQVEQVQDALEAGATLVLCDNMTPAEVAASVAIVRAHPRRLAGSVLVEASGRITLDNVGDYAVAGADVISVGAITHSAAILDIGLDLDRIV
jgi:nicotinate-nucleotide pyrophosphorylase (carboxylating)